MNNEEKILEILDLSPSESRVYLAILKLGQSGISDISIKSGVKRTTIYNHLDELIKKGLIFKTAKKKRIVYCAENPRKILGILESKKVKIEKIIPELESMYSVSFNKPKVSFYEGKEGLRSIYKEVTSTSRNVYSYFSPKSVFSVFSLQENHELLMRLYNNGGILHNLVEKSDEAVERLKIREYQSFVKNKVLPDELKFQTDLLVFGNKVALISFKNMVGAIIEDEAIANMQKNLFKFIWKSIK
jgi:sugar-specific transcriptional regulator TrmB